MNFKKKNDFNLNAGTNLSSQGNFQGGYAFSNHFGFITGLNSARMPFQTDKYEENKDYAYIWNNELIYFNNINDKFIPAVNVGFGFGNMANNIEYFDLNMYRYFVQPSFGFVQKHLELALSTRFSKVQYDFIQRKDFVNDKGISLYEYYDLRDIGKQDFYFVEPAFTIGFRFENFSIRYQIINNIKVSSGDIYYKKKAQFFSLNVTFNLDEISRQ